jgi:hypothetical protein
MHVCNILVGKPEGKKTLGRPKHRWEGNIKMDMKEIGWVSMDWIYLVQDRGQMVDCCEYGNECTGSVVYGEFLDYLRYC